MEEVYKIIDKYKKFGSPTVAITDVAEIIRLMQKDKEEQLAIQRVKNWVAVDDAKPQENQVVWVITEQHQGPFLMEYAYIDDGDNSGWVWATVYDAPTYHKGKWQSEGEWDDDYEVKFWMALPEPPCS